MRRILDQLGIRREDQPVLYRIALIAVLLLASNGATFSLLDHEYEASLREIEEAADPAADPTPLTEQQRVEIIFTQFHALGAEIPEGTPNQQQAQRRRQYGQVMCELAIVMQPDPAWQEHVDFACASLAEHWPEYGCPVCDR